MGLFRTRRPMLVDAMQCEAAATIFTENGPQRVEAGDWLVRGEAGEKYVIDDAHFQSIFAPHEIPRVEEGRHYGC